MDNQNNQTFNLKLVSCPKIIKAIVESNSCDDKYKRVRLSSLGVWIMTDLIMSIGGIPLKVGDSVFVDVSEGYESPLILGRLFDDGLINFMLILKDRWF